MFAFDLVQWDESTIFKNRRIVDFLPCGLFNKKPKSRFVPHFTRGSPFGINELILLRWYTVWVNEQFHRNYCNLLTFQE